METFQIVLSIGFGVMWLVQFTMFAITQETKHGIWAIHTLILFLFLLSVMK